VAQEQGESTVRRTRPKDKRLYWRGDVLWARVFGKRSSTGCRDEQAASAVADDLERRSKDPTYARAHQATLAGALSMLLADLDRRGRSAATKKKASQKRSQNPVSVEESGEVTRSPAAIVPAVYVAALYIDPRGPYPKFRLGGRSHR
jgi:hypothetical protein